MWAEKTKEDFKKERISRLKGSAIDSFFISIICFLFIEIASKFGCRGWSIHQTELSWAKVFERLPYDLILFPIIFILFAISSYFETGSTIVCRNCNKAGYGKGETCSCGGKFINLDKYKWIDDDN